MDVITVNDRHLYQGRVVVQDLGNPSARSSYRGDHPIRTRRLADREATLTEDAEIELYPTSRLLAVTVLREVGASGRQPGKDG